MKTKRRPQHQKRSFDHLIGAASRVGDTSGPSALAVFRLKMGLDVTVASEPGKGSVFSVRLPGGAPS
jgi:hypothetical protein